MAELFVGIDSGTQGSKVVVVSRNTKKIIAQGYAKHALMQDAAGKREQNPADWISAIESALKSALANPQVDVHKICAIGVSGQQHGFVPLDAKGEVIRPAKLWCDTATGTQAQQLTQALGGENEAIRLTGNTIAVGFTASKIRWLRENEPENYDRLATVLLPHDYINFWLTGEQKSECGDASGTAYFDVRQRQWSQPVLQAIDPSGKLETCLPWLIESQESVGTIRPEIAEKFGLCSDVVVASGGGDNMMAAIGTGNVKPGVVTASLGTSGTIYCYSDFPVVDEKGELAAFCSSTGHWLPLVCTMNVTVATELNRALFQLDLREFNTLVEKTGAGAEGLILLPYFNGERTPALPNASATLAGLNSLNYSPQNVCRAAMEGATFGLYYGFEVMQRNGIEAQEIRLVGGGAKSKIWRQIVADVFDCPVVCPQNTEAGALGAAIQAMWCYKQAGNAAVSLPELADAFVALDNDSRAIPDSGNVVVYQEIYEKYLRLNTALADLY